MFAHFIAQRSLSYCFAVSLNFEQRAVAHAALGDVTRLAIVDALRVSDRSPSELGQLFDVTSNLLSHHLDALEAAGLIERVTSHGDRRRRYIRLIPSVLSSLVPAAPSRARDALFVCTHNSARSQLAAALWQQITRTRGDSAGTHPADAVHPGAVAAARRHHLTLLDQRPRSLSSVKRMPSIVITVCDQAHEELAPDAGWLHWSLPDPALDPRPAVFDATVAELRRRIVEFAPAATGKAS